VSHRVEKIANAVRGVVSDAIQHRLSDPRISPLASVTRVAVSGDLLFANVYVSVMGTEAEQRKCLRGLHHAKGYIQTLLARRLQVRQCPRIEFFLDASIKKATEMIRVIDETMAEHCASESSVASEGETCETGEDADDVSSQVGPGTQRLAWEQETMNEGRKRL